MERFSQGFTKFMVTAIKILLPIVIIGAIGRAFADNLIPKFGFVIILAIYAGVIYTLYKFYKEDKLSNKVKLITIITIAIIVRGLWLLNTDTVMFSDFQTMYSSAQNVLNGDYSAFMGSAYIARFPHLTIMVLYFAAMIKIFGETLVALKVVNLIMGTLAVYLIYKISTEVFNSTKYGILGGGIAAIFPPMVTYVGVFCTENIAIPFYLAGIYLFILATKKNKAIGLFILAGVLLSVGNLFRMVGIITLIAMSIYIVIYLKNNAIYKVKAVASLIVAFMIVLIGTNAILQGMKITEYPLWSGSEPSSTNILKGTNIKSMGMWNEEDAGIPALCNYDYEKMDTMSKEIIKERLTTTPIYVTIPFYIAKFSTQWYDGDCGGTFWTEQGVTDEDILIKVSSDGRVIFQVFYIILLILAWRGLKNKRIYTNDMANIKLFYLMLCGYGVSYLITENQSRYAYIVSWLFIIFALAGVEELKKWRNS